MWLLWRGFVDSYRNPGVHILRIVQKMVCTTTFVQFDQKLDES